MYPIFKFVLILILFSFNASATLAEKNSQLQTETHAKLVKKFNYFGKGGGMEDTTVVHIVEDKFGFIWFSSINGIYRFDGQEFKGFNTNNSSLSSSFITTMFVSANGTLWVGTESGLNKYDASQEQFVQLTNKELIDGNIWSLFEDNKQQLWIGTSTGLYVLNSENEQLKQLNFAIDGVNLELKKVKTIYQDANNLMWLSTDHGKNYFINLINNQVYSLDGNNYLNLQLPNKKINHIVKSNNEELFFIQDKAIYEFKNNRIQKKFEFNIDQTVKFKRAIIDRNNQLWVTSTQGLWSFFISDGQFIQQSNDEAHIEAFDILYDVNNVMWFGTVQNGLGQQTHQNYFFSHLTVANDSLQDDAAWSIAEGNDNEVWIGGNSPTITRFNTKTKSIKRFNSGLNGIKSLIIEKNNDVYIGANNGLFYYSNQQENDSFTLPTSTLNIEKSTKLIDFEVTYLTSDTSYIYVSSWGQGLYRYAKKTNSPQRLEKMLFDGQSIPYVTTLKTVNNRLYVGTLNGAYVFDLKKEISKEISSLQGQRISYFDYDDLGVYASAGMNGVYLLDHENASVIKHHRQSKLTERLIYAGLKDEQGNLWMSSNQGIVKLSSDESIESYDTSDGLQADDFNDNSALKTTDGRLFFGGAKGVNFIDPNHLDSVTKPSPNLLFTNITVFNNPININQKIDNNVRLTESIVTSSKVTLKYSDYPFELMYNLVNYPQVHKVRYRYKMNGLDNDWLMGKKNRTATYTNLDAGDHRFDVEAIDRHSGQVIAKNSIKVIILPPLWWSPAAIFLYVILTISFFMVGGYAIRERSRATKTIGKVAKRLEFSLWGSGDLMWDWNISSNEVYHSGDWSQFDYQGLTDNSLAKIHPKDRDKVAKCLKDHLVGVTDFFEASYRIKRHNNDNWCWITDKAKIVSRSDDDRKPLRMAGTIRDITLLKEAQERLNLQANVMSNVSDAIYVLDLAFNIVDVNKAFLQTTGLTFNSVYGNNSLFNTYPVGIAGKIKQRLTKGLAWAGEVKAEKPNGDFYQIELKINTMLNEDGEISHYVAAFSDITKRKQTEDELRSLSNIDPLTKLPNRSYFQHAHRNLIRRKDPHALLTLDIDNFKKVNDSMGHDEGDKLLCLIAERIDLKINCQHLLCRLGGDEFSVLLEDTDDISLITHVLYEIEAAMQDPFYLNDEMFVMSCSVGVAIFPNDGITTESLLQSSDTAMYHAKYETGFSYQFFNSSMNDSAVRRIKVESLIRQALKNDWFEVYYQPKIDVITQTIMGMEALVRLDHPEQGMIYPNEFIPIAEDTGLIIAIGEKVLDKACYATQQWRKNGLFNGRVAVNLASKQFAQEDLLQRIEHILTCTQLPAANLELEITESTVIENPELAIKTMQKLSDRGIHLALDDFGTGYSSLSYLKRFPIHTLKIDKAFIDDLNNEKNEKHMVASIISIAHNMKLSVVAEGVEEEIQVSALAALHCETIQGYFYSKPLAENDFTDFLTKSNLSKNYNKMQIK